MLFRILCFIGLSTVLASSAFADRIVVGHDVNTLSSSVAGPNEDQFAVNLAYWLTDATSSKILTVTTSSGATTFSDIAHVLDTGGFDFACLNGGTRNESLQWRPIGTAGIENPSGAPPSSAARQSRYQNMSERHHLLG